MNDEYKLNTCARADGSDDNNNNYYDDKGNEQVHLPVLLVKHSSDSK